MKKTVSLIVDFGDVKFESCKIISGLKSQQELVKLLDIELTRSLKEINKDIKDRVENKINYFTIQGNNVRLTYAGNIFKKLFNKLRRFIREIFNK